MRVCIDAGHEYYGGNKGVASYGEREEVITFKLAEKLKKILLQNNIEVVMTRSHLTTTLAMSKTQSMMKRTEIANKSSCDLFISLHCGSNASIRHNGTETQVCRLGGEDEKIATIIQKNIIERVGTNDRGIRKKSGDLLGYILSPAILVELAFITNESDVELLREHLDDFAKAIFDGICEYFEICVGRTKSFSEPEDIVNRLSGMIQIIDKSAAVEAVERAKRANDSLYWILYKIVNK